jgi:DNA-binding MarR family transcriptional regulator
MKRERQDGAFFRRSELSASDWHKDLLISWLFRTSARMQTSLDLCFMKFGMTLQEAIVLLRCVQAGTISPGRLASVLGKDKAKITRFIDRLDTSRLVTRDVLRRDRRFSIIKPTGKGRQLARELVVVFNRIRKELFTGIVESDVRCLERMLPQLFGNASRIGSQHKRETRGRRRRIGTQRSEAKRTESQMLQSDQSALASSLNANGRKDLLEESAAFQEFKEEGEGLIAR